MTEPRTKYLVALGANLESQAGNPAETLAASVQALAGAGLELAALSRFYRTPCFPIGEGPDFVNAVAEVRSVMGPQDVLAALHRIEAEFGRERKERWAARKLDLDLLTAGDLVAPDRTVLADWMALDLEAQKTRTPDRMVLPHPRLQDRAFVLVPMADIAAGWVHPVLGRSAAEMLAALPAADRLEVVAL
ncbi:2-amino-4-hydroxy-6-hydroxymethyldihydropteridine diphosphokinase [Chachezhania antarctica]|uniref:2-amino-4-hydroxy-6- hydroxymethyldihydropteridine diphosphokinase n=1 Tax=Chachezhania antarctica TaxID=2340860 RepID=UPI000EAEC529|nr:2-amino-4-hydroxy-6-hydroxymethyldihydropteridine diphosphokinase [Chachezhania antarctica]|tara:strand:+ start:687 stop:1256 length:570 start_codon:yes stop_codon:yes gene_type:complete